MSKEKDFLTDDEMAALESSSEPRSSGEPKDFISDDEMSILEAKSADAPGIIETFGRSLLNAATMNYGPEILAATDIDPSKAYGTKLREQVDRQDAGEMENPASSTMGTAAGIGASMLTGAPAAGIAKKGAQAIAKIGPEAAKKIAPFISEVLVNMGMNFAQNPGHDTTGDADEIALRADQATSPLSVATSVAGPTVGKILEKAVDPIEQGISALGFRKGDIKNMMTRSDGSTLSETNVVNEAKKMKILRPATTLEGIHERAMAKKEEVGRKIGAIMSSNSDLLNDWYTNLPATTRQMFDRHMVSITPGSPQGSAAIRNAVSDVVSPYGSRGEAAAKEAMSVIEASTQGGKGDLEDLWKLKGRLGKLVYGETNAISKSGAPTLQKEAYEAALRKVDEMIDAHISLLENGLLSSIHSQGVSAYNRVKFKGLSQQYADLKKQYSIADSVEKSTLDRIAAERGRSFTVRDLLPSTSVPAALSSAGTAIKTMNRAPLIQPAIIGATRPPILYGGFPEHETQEVHPMDLGMMESEISREDLPPSEKAKRLNLLRKYGRVYVGP